MRLRAMAAAPVSLADASHCWEAKVMWLPGYMLASKRGRTMATQGDSGGAGPSASGASARARIG